MCHEHFSKLMHNPGRSELKVMDLLSGKKATIYTYIILHTVSKSSQASGGPSAKGKGGPGPQAISSFSRY